MQKYPIESQIEKNRKKKKHVRYTQTSNIVE